MGFGSKLSGSSSSGAGLSSKAGNQITRDVDSGTPLAAADSASVLITDVLMDDEYLDGSGDVGVEWSASNDRFDVTDSGIYFVAAEIDFTTEASGYARLQLRTHNGTFHTFKTVYRDFVGVDLYVIGEMTLWLGAGGWVDLTGIQNSGTAGTIDYAYLSIQRVG